MFRTLAILIFIGAAVNSSAQLFDNLRALSGSRYAVGDPLLLSTNAFGSENEGPKDVAVADLDGDLKPDLAASNKDGSVTLRFGTGDGTFSEPTHLRTFAVQPIDAAGFSYTNVFTNSECIYYPTNLFVTNFAVIPPLITTNQQMICSGLLTNVVYTNIWTTDGPAGLRGLSVADWNGDSKPDIAVASPGESVIYLFNNEGSRRFSEPRRIAAWLGVRDLARGDFDGDGKMDLAAAGTTNGLVQYRGNGDGTFQFVTNHWDFGTKELWDEFPQPAFYLRTARAPGASSDDLIAGRAQYSQLLILRKDESGALAIFTNLITRATALDTGPLLNPANSSISDLVTGFSRNGTISIYAGRTNHWQFDPFPKLSLNVPGAPRNVRIADLDNDGWNDLIVVSQTHGKIVIYKNQQGTFVLANEAFAGDSPREMDLGDFNGDGRQDLAVLNRFSFDVSILLTSTNLSLPVGFLAMDGIYAVDGGVSGVQLQDFNKDGRPDVLQLHRDTAEYSVRLSDTNGALSAPQFFQSDAFQPAAQVAVDVNGDANPDSVSANLSGSVTVALGDGKGGFGAAESFSLPADANGALFALVPGDFNGDGKIDIAAGYLDCRVSFFKGDGQGKFIFTHTHLFIYEPRSMIAGDFDQDGDLDLAGGSIFGTFVIVDNPGDLLSAKTLVKKEYAGLEASAGAILRMVDQNKDSDPDFLFGSEGGFELYLGGPGLTFVKQAIKNNSGFRSSTFVLADLDGDGDSDVASISPSKVSLTISVYTNSNYAAVLNVPVPVTRYLASADLDGDGLPDLVGSGDVLWVALSSHRSRAIARGDTALARQTTGRVVINEILAQNTGLELELDGGRMSDWIEIYNGQFRSANMAGWRLNLVETNSSVSRIANGAGIVLVTNTVTRTNIYTFPTNAVLAANSYRLIVFSDKVRSAYHAGFNLPAEGGKLKLIDNAGNEVDRVTYPQLEEDISFARYQDGVRTFVANIIPSPGSANVDNGALDPILSFDGVDLDTISIPRQSVRFRASARDDVGIVNVSLLWRRLDIPDNESKRIILYDDGINEDGPAFDGNYSGVLPERLPAGAEIQFYVECTDLTDQVVITPGSARFVGPGQKPETHSLTIGARREQLEISEVVANNVGGLQDEQGGTPDWIEIRNISESTVSLEGVGVSGKFFGSGERLDLSSQGALNPGQHLIVFADSKPGQGALHAPFEINRNGERLVLTGTSTNGVRYLIDSISFGPRIPNVALARMGKGGPWIDTSPTPYAGNINTAYKTFAEGGTFHLIFGTRPDKRYTVEYADEVSTANWTALPEVFATGLEHAVRQPINARRFYRVRDQAR